VAFNPGAFGNRKTARRDIAVDAGARTDCRPFTSDHVAAQLAHHQQARCLYLPLYQGFLRDYDQLGRSYFAAEPAFDSDRLVKDEFARDVDVAANRYASALLDPCAAWVVRKQRRLRFEIGVRLKILSPDELRSLGNSRNYCAGKT
jgi:hypothetical protein